MKKNRILPFWCLFSVLAMSVVAFSAIRLKYGSDVTDNAYWIAEPYLMLNGAVPFATSWSQTPLTNILIVPLPPISIYNYLYIN